MDERIYKDVQDLVFTRIRESVLIQKNITPQGSKANVNSEEVKAAQTNFAHYIIQASRGNFLYVDLVLNFVKEGKLQVKSSSFKSIPTTLSEVFQLAFNLKYPTHEAFLKVKDLICIMAASLRPLSQGQLFDCINALKMDGLSQGQLEEKIKHLGWIIKVKSNGAVTFFHPTVRDWLVGRRSTSDSSGFVCDPREGHAAIGNKAKKERKKGHRPLSIKKASQHNFPFFFLCYSIETKQIFKGSWSRRDSGIRASLIKGQPFPRW